MNCRLGSVAILLGALGWIAGCDLGGGTNAALPPGSIVNPNKCSTPTAAQCVDEAWLAKDSCGQQQRSCMKTSTGKDCACNQVLADAAKSTAAGLKRSSFATAESWGGSADLLHVPNPASGLSKVSFGLSRTGQVQAAAVEATTQLSAEERALRSTWLYNSNRVESCREYVYEKYYDYSRFEDASLLMVEDFAELTALAFGSYSKNTSIGTKVASGYVLKSKQGSDMELQELPLAFDWLPSPAPQGWLKQYSGVAALKNPLFAMPLHLIEEPSLEATVEAGRYASFAPSPLPAGWSWSWHQSAYQAAKSGSFSLARLDAAEALLVEFREVLLHYEEISMMPRVSCELAIEPLPPGCSEYLAHRASVEQRLQELFAEGVSLGCLDSSAPTLCDWSPRLFIDTLRSFFGNAMEQDYQRCLELTGDDFVALRSTLFRLPDNTLWTPPGYTSSASGYDFAKTATAVDDYAVVLEQYAEAIETYWETAAQNIPSELVDKSGGNNKGKLKKPSGSAGDLQEAGNDLFGVNFDYGVSWNMGAGENELSLSQLCLADVEAHAHARAEGWAFNSGRKQAFNLQLHGYMRQGAESTASLSILDNQIWKPEPFTIPDTFGEEVSNQKTNPLYHPFTIFQGSLPFSIAGIPLVVSGGVSGLVDMQYDMRGHYQTSDEGEPCLFSAGYDVFLQPLLKLDAFAAVAVDMIIVSAGIRCDLTLLRVDLPFDLSISLVQEEAGINTITLNKVSEGVGRERIRRLRAWLRIDSG